MDKKKIIYLAVLLVAVGVLVYDKMAPRPGQEQPAVADASVKPAAHEAVKPAAEPAAPDSAPRPAGADTGGLADVAGIKEALAGLNQDGSMAERLSVRQQQERQKVQRDVFIPAPHFGRPAADKNDPNSTDTAVIEDLRLEVNGIMLWNNEYRVCLNNDSVLRQGQHIGRWLIKAIHADSVELQSGPEQIRLFVVPVMKNRYGQTR